MNTSINLFLVLCYVISTTSVSGQIRRGEFFGDENIPTDATLTFPADSTVPGDTFRPFVQRRVSDIFFFGTRYNDIQVRFQVFF